MKYANLWINEVVIDTVAVSFRSNVEHSKMRTMRRDTWNRRKKSLVSVQTNDGNREQWIRSEMNTHINIEFETTRNLRNLSVCFLVFCSHLTLVGHTRNSTSVSRRFFEFFFLPNVFFFSSFVQHFSQHQIYCQTILNEFRWIRSKRIL